MIHPTGQKTSPKSVAPKSNIKFPIQISPIQIPTNPNCQPKPKNRLAMPRSFRSAFDHNPLENLEHKSFMNFFYKKKKFLFTNSTHTPSWRVSNNHQVKNQNKSFQLLLRNRLKFSLYCARIILISKKLNCLEIRLNAEFLFSNSNLSGFLFFCLHPPPIQKRFSISFARFYFQFKISLDKSA